MNELIKIETREGIETVNARELWQKLQSKQQFADWVKDRVELFIEGADYLIHKFMNNPLGGRPTIDYYLTIDAAKHIAMLERNEIGRKIRQYFIDFEKKAKNIIKSVSNNQKMAELRRAYDRGLISADEYRAGIGLQYPKADMLDPGIAKQVYAVTCAAIEKKKRKQLLEDQSGRLF